MATKTIRLIKPWHLHQKGAQFTLEDHVADLMIQSGRAEAVEAPAKVESKPEQKAEKKPAKR